MATNLNQLGPFPFASASGPRPAIIQEDIETVRRKGVPVVGVFENGVAAEPFQVVSFADTASPADAADLAELYGTIAGATLWDLKLAGVVWSRMGYLVVVTRVEIMDWGRLLAGLGGFEATPGGFVRARWFLQPIIL